MAVAVIEQCQDQLLVLDPGGFGNDRSNGGIVREVTRLDEMDVLPDFIHPPSKKQAPGFEVTQLQDEKGLGLDRVEQFLRGFFFCG